MKIPKQLENKIIQLHKLSNKAAKLDTEIRQYLEDNKY